MNKHKSTAWITLFLFILTQSLSLDFALATSLPVQTPIPDHNASTLIQIPKEWGHIEDYVVQDAGNPTLIHIKEAHGHYEIQKNIEAILNYLKEHHNFKTVLLEGSAFKLNTKQFNFSSPEDGLNAGILDALAKEALASGPELVLAQDSGFEMEGIEDAESYAENGKAFRDVLLEKSHSKAFTKQLFMQIERLSSPYLDSRLRRFLDRKHDFEDELIPLQEWLNYLKFQAEDYLKINLENPFNQIEWPTLSRVYMLKKLEQKFSLTAFNTEKELFLRRINQFTNLDSRIKNQIESVFLNISMPQEELESVFFRLVKQLPEDFDYDHFPQVNNKISQMILKDELNGSHLAGELNRLSLKIANHMAQSEKERKIIEILEDFNLIKKLFKLELTPEQFETLSNNREHFKPTRFLKVLLELNQDQRVRDGHFAGFNQIEELYNKALTFYEGAKKRDQEMIRNTHQFIRQNESEKFILITGGFHAEPIKKYFLEQNFNFLTIVPSMNELESRESYVNLILDYYGEHQNSLQSTYRNIPYLATSDPDALLMGVNLPKLREARINPVIKKVKRNYETVKRSETRKEPLPLVNILSEEEASHLARSVTERLGGGVLRTLEMDEYGLGAIQTESFLSEKPEEAFNVLRIGSLIFIEINRQDEPFDLETGENNPYYFERYTESFVVSERGALQRQLGNLYENNPGNIFFVMGHTFTKFSWTTIAAMWANRDRFPGSIIVDMGAGDGVLSRVAYGLGAEKLILVEGEEHEKERQYVQFDLSTLALPEDRLVQLTEDINRFDGGSLKSAIGRDNRPVIGLANIGPYYGKTHVNAVEKLLSLDNLKVIVQGGFSIYDAEHTQQLDQLITKFVDEYGFSSEPYSLFGILSTFSLRSETRKPPLLISEDEVIIEAMLETKSRYLMPTYGPKVEVRRSQTLIRAEEGELFSLHYHYQDRRSFDRSPRVDPSYAKFARGPRIRISLKQDSKDVARVDLVVSEDNSEILIDRGFTPNKENQLLGDVSSVAIWVSKDYQRRNIASTLMGIVFQLAERLGAQRVIGEDMTDEGAAFAPSILGGRLDKHKKLFEGAGMDSWPEVSRVIWDLDSISFPPLEIRPKRSEARKLNADQRKLIRNLLHAMAHDNIAGLVVAPSERIPDKFYFTLVTRTGSPYQTKEEEMSLEKEIVDHLDSLEFFEGGGRAPLVLDSREEHGKDAFYGLDIVVYQMFVSDENQKARFEEWEVVADNDKDERVITEMLTESISASRLRFNRSEVRSNASYEEQVKAILEHEDAAGQKAQLRQLLFNDSQKIPMALLFDLLSDPSRVRQQVADIMIQRAHEIPMNALLSILTQRDFDLGVYEEFYEREGLDKDIARMNRRHAVLYVLGALLQVPNIYDALDFNYIEGLRKTINARVDKEALLWTTEDDRRLIAELEQNPNFVLSQNRDLGLFEILRLVVLRQNLYVSKRYQMLKHLSPTRYQVKDSWIYGNVSIVIPPNKGNPASNKLYATVDRKLDEAVILSRSELRAFEGFEPLIMLTKWFRQGIASEGVLQYLGEDFYLALVNTVTQHLRPEVDRIGLMNLKPKIRQFVRNEMPIFTKILESYELNPVSRQLVDDLHLGTSNFSVDPALMILLAATPEFKYTVALSADEATFYRERVQEFFNEWGARLGIQSKNVLDKNLKILDRNEPLDIRKLVYEAKERDPNPRAILTDRAEVLSRFNIEKGFARIILRQAPANQAERLKHHFESGLLAATLIDELTKQYLIVHDEASLQQWDQVQALLAEFKALQAFLQSA